MKFIAPQHDLWHAADGEDAPAPAERSLLRLDQWQAVRERWPARLSAGVLLPNDADVETLEHDLPRLSLLALQFPKWIDGRAYSQAVLLRRRLRYRGEIRAVGEVLVDMLPLLQRSGFDAVQLRADQKIEHARRALGFFGRGHYQGDVNETQPRFARSAA